MPTINSEKNCDLILAIVYVFVSQNEIGSQLYSIVDARMGSIIFEQSTKKLI